MMDHRIEKIKKFREFLLKQLEGLTTKQLNNIPKGYNNNIIWNLAHLISANQSLCYLRSGQPARVDQKYILPFFTNTKPVDYIHAHEVTTIKLLFLRTIDVLAEDYENKIFENYTPSENILRIYGFELKTIDDALDFLLFHEGFHSGYITSLIRLVAV